MPKLSLLKIKRSRESDKLIAKTFKIHPHLAQAFKKQSIDEGVKQVHLLERAIVFYINHGGESAKIL